MASNRLTTRLDDSINALRDERYVSLTTYRRDGRSGERAANEILEQLS